MLALFLTIFLSQAHAKKLDLSPHFTDLRTTPDTQLQTNESIITVNGKKYKEIQYKSEYYYFKFYDQEHNLADESGCQTLYQSYPEESVRLVRTEVRVTKRATAYIEGLRTKCNKVSSFDPEIGFEIQNKNGTKKSVFISPFHGGNPLVPSAGIRFKNKKGDKKEVFVSPAGAGAGMDW